MLPFLLTRLLRGATFQGIHFRFSAQISTHVPLARRDRSCRRKCNEHRRFLLTRLLRGATIAFKICFQRCKFLLTRLLRGATVGTHLYPGLDGISTHAPLARRDARIPVFPGIVAISTHAPLARRDERYPDPVGR